MDRPIDDHVEVDPIESPYELVDIGDGRRLERFGGVVVDRPVAGQVGSRRDLPAWRAADLRFDRNHGWSGPRAGDGAWCLALDGLTFELRLTDAGQVGLFPEQRPTWHWLAEQVRRRGAARVLNLFAYTGAATLAAAAAGAEVVHVDAARPAVAWARRNAELSALAARPVRWLVDDAEGFLRREARRGHRYDGIVLDPPSYGHGPAGRQWRLEERLEGLLAGAAAVAERDAFLALSHHTPGIDDERLRSAIGGAFPGPPLETGELRLEARSGASLPLGTWARVAPGR